MMYLLTLYLINKHHFEINLTAPVAIDIVAIISLVKFAGYFVPYCGG